MKKFFWTLLASITMLCSTANAKTIVLQKQNTVVLDTEFDYTTVAKVQQQVNQMNVDLAPDVPIYFVINSGGGMITAGLELIDTLKSLDRPVHTISLFSASMAFQTVQSLGDRYITSSGTLMTHKARGMFGGEFPGQMDSRYDYWLRKISKLDKMVVERTAGKHTLESYRTLYENEYWCDGQDCVDQGFADQVVNVQCSGSLYDQSKSTENFSFMGMKITVHLVKSECPIITGPLDFTVAANGVIIFQKEKASEYSWRQAKVLESIKDFEALMREVEKRVYKKNYTERVMYTSVDTTSDNDRLETTQPTMTP